MNGECGGACYALRLFEGGNRTLNISRSLRANRLNSVYRTRAHVWNGCIAIAQPGGFSRPSGGGCMGLDEVDGCCRERSQTTVL